MADEAIPSGERMPDNVRSIADQAEDEGAVQEEFPKGIIDAGAKRKTLKTLIGGLPAETTVSMMSAEVPLRGGLPDPDTQHRFVTTTELHKAEEIAQREDGLLVSWKVRSHLRPVYVETVDNFLAALSIDQLEALLEAKRSEREHAAASNGTG